MYNHLKHKVKQEIVKAKTNWAAKSSVNSRSMWKIVSGITGKHCNSIDTTCILHCENNSSLLDIAESINNKILFCFSS